FWEQNRLGMLLPWLAQPIESPFANLLVQCGVAIWFSLATFFLLARYLVRGPAWPWIGLGGVFGLLVLSSDETRFTQMAGHQPYFISMGLALAAMLVTTSHGRMRFLIGLTLMILAAWVNLTVAIVLGPLVLLHGIRERGVSLSTKELGN